MVITTHVMWGLDTHRRTATPSGGSSHDLPLLMNWTRVRLRGGIEHACGKRARCAPLAVTSSAENNRAFNSPTLMYRNLQPRDICESTLLHQYQYTNTSQHNTFLVPLQEPDELESFARSGCAISPNFELRGAAVSILSGSAVHPTVFQHIYFG